MALQVAIAYTWITEGTYDQDYLDTHSVGFEEFRKYVMGDEDGIPKTPAWASPLCGVSTWTIKALAREWASRNTCTGHNNGGSFIRGPYSHEPARLEATLLAMQGLGKPGVHIIGSWGIVNPPRHTTRPRVGATGVGRESDIKQFMTKTIMHHAVLDGHSEQWGTTSGGAPVENQFVKYEYPIPAEEGGTEVHMMWLDNPCWTVCWNWGYGYMQAFRSPKIECIVAEHQWMEDDCYFADVILPISCQLECDDIDAYTRGHVSWECFTRGKKSHSNCG
jgi:trimethylamine-N-oxide reductase (cytochrome c)